MRRIALTASILALVGCSLFADLGGFSQTTVVIEPEGGAAGGDGSTASGDGGTTTPFDAASVPNAGSAYVTAVLADGPIAYYPLEETSGTTAQDVIGGKHATWKGSVQLGVPAVVGGGATFDGETTRLEMPVGAFTFEGKVPYTIELWLNAAQVTGNVRFVLDEGSGATGSESDGYQIYFSDTFFLSSRSNGNGGADGYASIPSPIPSNQPIHIVFTHDGTVTRLYANGVSNGTANANLAIPASPASRLVFGDSFVGQFFKLAGTLDEIAIYDKALSAERVEAHHDAAPK